jgi:hypothetical protein
MDGLTISRLLNSVTNKLIDNRTLGDGYYIAQIIEVENNTEFDDSATIGGEITVMVHECDSQTLRLYA